MHEELKQIPVRVLEMGLDALTQANTHAVFYDPGKEHWERMAILHAALAGELCLKAIIASEHPLLIFKDLFHLEDPGSTELSIEKIIETGRTYSFEHLPKLLWVTTGERLPDMDSFDKIRKARNSIQHFCAPDNINFMKLSLHFIYNNIDPLLQKYFDLYAIEFHEDEFDDYIVQSLVRNELLFSVPENFELTEIDLSELVSESSSEYKRALLERLPADASY